ncbi:MAG TPA: 5'/3'-nucleotidase SurE [Anaerolineae bacterium]|nr:5'/3'-nucleotidase SurE [Anaerolineae bacterium]
MTRILLTNDDGIEAPGLRSLLQAILRAVTPDDEITLFAPDHNWSAAGHTKTMHKPLRVTAYPLAVTVDGAAKQVPAYTTTGAPSDCVALALLGILPERPDLVVSGINLGPNLGHDITYSGTVAAAIEGVIAGVPAVAVSLDTYELGRDFCFAAQVAARVIGEILARANGQNGLPVGTLLNVNVPALAAEEIAGVAITRLGRRVYRDVLVERHDPRGRPYYWIGGEPPAGHLDEGTDIWAVAHGYVSITPIQLDLTAHELIPLLEGWDF